jgi:hypothetical protein
VAVTLVDSLSTGWLYLLADRRAQASAERNESSSKPIFGIKALNHQPKEANPMLNIHNDPLFAELQQWVTTTLGNDHPTTPGTDARQIVHRHAQAPAWRAGDPVARQAEDHTRGSDAP